MEGKGEDTLGMGWCRNENAPTTGAAAAMVGRSMASQGQRKSQAANHRRRTERGRDGVGRGRYWVGRGHGLLEGGIHSRCQRAWV